MKEVGKEEKEIRMIDYTHMQGIYRCRYLYIYIYKHTPPKKRKTKSRRYKRILYEPNVKERRVFADR
jgi:hypothetical protein